MQVSAKGTCEAPRWSGEFRTTRVRRLVVGAGLRRHDVRGCSSAYHTLRRPGAGRDLSMPVAWTDARLCGHDEASRNCFEYLVCSVDEIGHLLIGRFLLLIVNTQIAKIAKHGNVPPLRNVYDGSRL
jgi:hypothetical protein